jgi:Cell wall-associated hydrolases (invasion-associated proteins)
VIGLGSCSLLRNKTNTSHKQDSDLTSYYKSWLGTRYLAGGTTKDGVDCSGFVQNVYKDVYGINLPRRSSDMETVVNPVDSRTDLREGDLVFFQNKSGQVNHVGIYLQQDTFVHSSTSKGVMVSNLNDNYWRDVYKHGGHHPQMQNKKSKHSIIKTPEKQTKQIAKQKEIKPKQNSNTDTQKDNIEFDVEF